MNINTLNHPSGTKGRVLRTLAGLVAGLAALAPALAATDLGPSDQSASQTVSLSLKLHNADQLASFINSTVTLGDPLYQQFLSVNDFTASYAPTPAEVAKVQNLLAAAGLQVTEVSANLLLIKASGTVGTLNRYFNTTIHEYQKGSVRYHAPSVPPTIPAAVGSSVLAVSGLSTEPIFRSCVQHAPGLTANQGSAPPLMPNASTATGVPGQFTVGDVAQMYQVNPLYQRGFTGAGRTIAIATLALFNPQDAYYYWNYIGLPTKAGRITEIQVPDGNGSPITYDGDVETTLDVEQAGGLAPDAAILVYEAPNTTAGWFALWQKIVTDNMAGTVSISWGGAESWSTPEQLQAESQLFMEAAAQGMSLFACTGDGGAYAINRDVGTPYGVFTDALTVWDPSSSPYITAAGGLTVKATFPSPFGSGTVIIPCDQAWAWDYFLQFFDPSNPFPYYNSWAFPIGGGGGVSVYWPVPKYQKHTAGIMQSAPGQSLIYYPNWPSLAGGQDWFDLPANFAGRNVPDISLNADPFTGYAIYYTGQATGISGWNYGFGGTSFADPQLNGITALLSQMAGRRLGLLNPVLYRIARNHGYDGNAPAFNDITQGDNLFFYAAPGYDPASGLGSINALNLGQRLVRGEKDND